VEEQLGLLAHHWERSEEREEAVHYLRRAGEQAAGQFANAEAVGYFSRAVELTPEDDLAGRYMLLLARERVRDLQGVRDAQVQDLSGLEVLADALQDDGKRAEVALRWAWYANYVADYPAGIAAARKAVSLAQTANDVRTEAGANVQWARGLEYQGNYSAAGNRLQQALTLARAAHFRRVEAECLYRIGRVSLAQDNHASTRAYYEQSLRISREIGDVWLGNRVRSELAEAVLEEGAYDEARTHLEQTLQVFREIGDPWHEGMCLGDLGLLFHHLGDYDRARAHTEQYLTICRKVHDRRGVSDALSDLSLLFHHMGEDEAALEYAQQALQMAQNRGDRSRQGVRLICLGHALAGLARLDEAGDAYGQALALVRELGQPHRSVDALAGLARVAFVQGDLRQAQAHAEEILSWLERGTLGGPLEPFRAHLTCYRVLSAGGDPRAREILERAHRLLQDRAAKISDERERRSYLENVQEHREIVEEYAQRAREYDSECCAEN